MLNKIEVDRFSVTPVSLNLLVSLFLVFFCNFSFFQHVVHVYPVSLKNAGFLASLVLGLAVTIMFLLTLIGSQFTTKPLLILILITSSVTAYFMDNYQVVMDHTMIKNILQTNINEAIDLFSVKLLLYFLLLGIFPSVFVYKIRIERKTWKRGALTKIKIAALSLLILLCFILAFSKFYASFFRENKPLRYYTNPPYFLYSIGKYIGDNVTMPKGKVQPVGLDAHIPLTDRNRELIILVVGEAARADHFSLNGYPRDTNPLLKKEDVVSFSRFYSNKTSTADALPNMFSVFPHAKYSSRKAATNENLLDVLRHAGVNILWRDDNSDSKGVAIRVPYQDFRKPGSNPICDVECRDEGMLVGLQDFINKQKQGDILIVLHQMGNHGPAYYKRYPAAFEKFTPVCRTNQLENCTTEEIGNAYDNAILYTDYFLQKVISLLKGNTNRFNTAMVYMSDHGESLGEYGLYLHGLPYAMAPDSQIHIASVLWLDDGFGVDKKALQTIAYRRLSHDNLFHTMLGLMEIKTSIYNRNLDILYALMPQPK